MDNAFGDLIRNRREGMGLKAYQLADRMGRKPSLISRLENQEFKETPAVDVITALSDELGIPQYVMLRALGYAVGPPETNVEEVIEPERAMLMSRLRRIPLTDPKTVNFLDSTLNNLLKLLAPGDLIEHGARAEDMRAVK